MSMESRIAEGRAKAGALFEEADRFRVQILDITTKRPDIATLVKDEKVRKTVTPEALELLRTELVDLWSKVGTADFADLYYLGINAERIVNEYRVRLNALREVANAPLAPVLPPGTPGAPPVVGRDAPPGAMNTLMDNLPLIAGIAVVGVVAIIYFARRNQA